MLFAMSVLMCWLPQLLIFLCWSRRQQGAEPRLLCGQCKVNFQAEQAEPANHQPAQQERNDIQDALMDPAIQQPAQRELSHALTTAAKATAFHVDSHCHHIAGRQTFKRPIKDILRERKPACNTCIPQ